MIRFVAVLSLLILVFPSLALAGNKPAFPAKLTLDQLIARLSEANYDAVRDLPPVQCDFKVEMEGADQNGKPTGKLTTLISGKLTVSMDPRSDYPLHTGFYGYHFDSFRIDIDSWPPIKELWEAGAGGSGVPDKAMADQYRRALETFKIPGSSLISSKEGTWLLSADGKSADDFSLDSMGMDYVFGIIDPSLCFRYQCLGYSLERQDLKSLAGVRTGVDTVAGHKATLFVYHIPVKKDKSIPDAFDEQEDTFKIWLAEESGLPIKEEGSYKGRVIGSTTYSSYTSFGKDCVGPAKWVNIHHEAAIGRMPAHDEVSEVDSAPLDSRWLLVKEVRLREKPGGSVIARTTYGNWRVAKDVNASTFALPKGARLVDPKGSDNRDKTPDSAGAK